MAVSTASADVSKVGLQWSGFEKPRTGQWLAHQTLPSQNLYDVSVSCQPQPSFWHLKQRLWKTISLPGGPTR